jgi:hypothetical protein
MREPSKYYIRVVILEFYEPDLELGPEPILFSLSREMPDLSQIRPQMLIFTAFPVASFFAVQIILVIPTVWSKLISQKTSIFKKQPLGNRNFGKPI